MLEHKRLLTFTLETLFKSLADLGADHASILRKQDDQPIQGAFLCSDTEALPAVIAIWDALTDDIPQAERRARVLAQLDVLDALEQAAITECEVQP